MPRGGGEGEFFMYREHGRLSPAFLTLPSPRDSKLWAHLGVLDYAKQRPDLGKPRDSSPQGLGSLPPAPGAPAPTPCSRAACPSTPGLSNGQEPHAQVSTLLPPRSHPPALCPLTVPCLASPSFFFEILPPLCPLWGWFVSCLSSRGLEIPLPCTGHSSAPFSPQLHERGLTRAAF